MSDEMVSNGAAPAKAPADTLSRWRVARGRALFLECLQQHVPVFWQELHGVTFQSESPDLALLDFAIRSNITDAWLITILRETVREWNADPDSAARLTDPRCLWFSTAFYSNMMARPFAVAALDRPCPSFFEPRDVFKRRMMAQCEAQLDTYMTQDYFGDFWDDPPNRRRDIAWAVAHFTGVPIKTIAADWKKAHAAGLSYNNQAAEQTVYRAVERFALEIGLALP